MTTLTKIEKLHMKDAAVHELSKLIKLPGEKEEWEKPEINFIVTYEKFNCMGQMIRKCIVLFPSLDEKGNPIIKNITGYVSFLMGKNRNKDSSLSVYDLEDICTIIARSIFTKDQLEQFIESIPEDNYNKKAMRPYENSDIFFHTLRVNRIN